MGLDVVPEVRLRALDDRAPRSDGEFVLYWMTAARRLRHNFSLDRALAWASELGKPLLIFEALRAGYEWASDRHHAFVLEGMGAHRLALSDSPVGYFAYVEPEPGHGRGLLAALAARACLVVTDDFPAFFIPRMLGAVAPRIGVRLEAVDGNGIYPLRSTERVFTTAASFRRHLQKELHPHLSCRPTPEPLAGIELPACPEVPEAIRERWPSATAELLTATPAALARLPIDHSVGPGLLRGGATQGRERMVRFLDQRLRAYGEGRNAPDKEVSSGLSPYLHFGHVGAHEVFHHLVEIEGWDPSRLAEKATGKREGWWGMSAGAESFLDELITWREIGFNRCALTDDFDRWESLPAWAKATLNAHEADDRPWLYSLEQLEAAQTHDEIWNAAQRQLLLEGRIHNYLRMLWGKKILEWSARPAEALEVMIKLNNRHALDGRDPNSYSGIFWTLGRYDRAWGPERPIFGKVRYMSSDSTRRKLPIKGYLARYGPAEGGSPRQAALF